MSQTIPQVTCIPHLARSMVRRMAGVLLCCLIALLPRFAQADEATPCSDAILKSLGDHVGVAHFVRPGPQSDATGLVVQDTCKIWPGDPNITLAVAVYADEPVKEGDDIGNWNVVIAMVDTHTFAVVALTKRSDGVDGVNSLGKYTLDMAPYRLAPNVRAFGVVFDSGTTPPRYVDGWYGNTLNLYVHNGRSLREVFSANLFSFKSLTSSLCSIDRCAVFEDSNLTVGVGKSTSHGFADLVVTANIDHYGPGEEVGPTRILRKTLHYDGRGYPTLPTSWPFGSRENP